MSGIRTFKGNETVYKGPGDGRTKVLLDPGSGGSPEMSMVKITFPSGGRTEEHERTVEETIYIVKGKTSIHSEGTSYELTEGDMIIIPPKTPHWHENSGSGNLEQIVIFSPSGPEQDIKEFPIAVDK